MSKEYEELFLSMYNKKDKFILDAPVFIIEISLLSIRIFYQGMLKNISKSK